MPFLLNNSFMRVFVPDTRAYACSAMTATLTTGAGFYCYTEDQRSVSAQRKTRTESQAPKNGDGAALPPQHRQQCAGHVQVLGAPQAGGRAEGYAGEGDRELVGRRVDERQRVQAQQDGAAQQLRQSMCISVRERKQGRPATMLHTAALPPI